MEYFDEIRNEYSYDNKYDILKMITEIYAVKRSRLQVPLYDTGCGKVDKVFRLHSDV